MAPHKRQGYSRSAKYNHEMRMYNLHRLAFPNDINFSLLRNYRSISTVEQSTSIGPASNTSNDVSTREEIGEASVTLINGPGEIISDEEINRDESIRVMATKEENHESKSNDEELYDDGSDHDCYEDLNCLDEEPNPDENVRNWAMSDDESRSNDEEMNDDGSDYDDYEDLNFLDEEPNSDEDARSWAMSDDESRSNDDQENQDETANNENEQKNGTSPPKKPFLSSALLNLDFPIHTKPEIRPKDHLVAVLALTCRYHHTYDSMLELLKYIDSTLVVNVLPKTKKSLWLTLSRNEENIICHLYCQCCRGYLGIQKESLKECACGSCGPRKPLTNVTYFLQLKLEPQLVELLTIPRVAEALQYRATRIKKDPDALEDLYDGKQYKNLTATGHFLSNPYNYSFKFNTDGASVADSAKSSAWPILLELNELSPHARKRHVLLAGIWVDKQHPIMNVFLSPLEEELNKLYTNGIVWKPPGSNVEVTSRFIAALCSVDSVARAPLLRMTQFNGEYGCSFCYAQGESIPGKRGSRVYSASIFPNETAPLRTHAEIREHMHEAFTKQQKVFGVKGPSFLLSVPEFDLSSGVVVESMHCVYLGVIKQHTTLLFLSKASDSWYIGNPVAMRRVDDRLEKIKPPSRISRKPRSIRLMQSWKASEWRNWLIYYCIVCLIGILDRKYLQHLALLAHAIYILNKDSITIAELDEAEMLLKNYVHQFEELFGRHTMTFNIHILTHLIDTVRNWGPLWATSAFNFESWNRKILQHVTSPQSRALQVATRFLMRKFIETSAYDDTLSPEIRRLIDHIFYLGNNEREDNERPDRHFTGIGKSTARAPRNIESQILQEAGYNCERLTSFKDAKINDIKYRCISKKPDTTFSNGVVYCNVLGFDQIIDIVQFDCRNETISGRICPFNQ